MHLPNIWGPGSLFAFSGLDGENTYGNSLAGTLSPEGVGVIFNTKTRRQLRFCLKDIKDINYEVVASDIIILKVKEKHSGKESAVRLAFYSQDTVVGSTIHSAVPYIFAEGCVQPEYKENMTIISADGEYTAFAKQHANGVIQFAFSYSKQSKQHAAKQAESALKADIDELVNKKINFFKKLPKKNDISKAVERTMYKCFSVMKSQVYTPEGMFKTLCTTPDRLPHKAVWLWDSVFHAIGNKYISKELAYESIKAILEIQKENGFIPHMSTPYNCSDITQPPVIAYGIYELYLYSGEKYILEETYEKLKKYLQWNMKNRDSNRNNLFEWKIENDNMCRCAECGMDNSPRFDDVAEMECIDFSCFMAKEAGCMAQIADILELDGEKQYWTALFEDIKHAVNHSLWDEEDQFYYDKIIAGGEFKKVKAVSSFLPLFAGICTPRRAEALVKHLENVNEFNTPFPIPSISLDDKTFGTDMWRGPVWINYNYMIAAGLKEYGYTALSKSIINKTVDTITHWYQQDGVVYEFYDSVNKVSPSKLNRKGPVIEPYDFRIRLQSIRDYGWSCTLFPAMVQYD